jgi:hypothetical protein
MTQPTTSEEMFSEFLAKALELADIAANERPDIDLDVLRKVVLKVMWRLPLAGRAVVSDTRGSYLLKVSLSQSAGK